MKHTAEQGLPKAFLNRLLDHVDPHQMHPYPILLGMVLLCARWVALRRMRLNLTIKELARRARIDAELVELLEAGQGQASDLQPAQIERLARLLATSRADDAWTQKVVALALGQTVPDAALVIKRVDEEIDALIRRPTPPVEEIAAHFDHRKFAILHAMAQLRTPQPSYTIAQFLFQKLLGIIRFNDASVLALLAQMQNEGLIERLSDMRVDESIDAQPRPYYRMTALGDGVYQMAKVNPSPKIQLIAQVSSVR